MQWGDSEQLRSTGEFSNGHEEHTALALQTMSLWVAAIADNIRNPVAGMGAALAVLRHQIDLKDQSVSIGNQHDPQHDPTILRHALEKIQHRLVSLNEYVTELVDFAKAPVLHKESAELKRVVVELEQGLRNHYPFTVQMTSQIDLPTKKSIVVDRERLKASLKALLVNGVDAACAFTSLNQDQIIPRVHLAVKTTLEGDERELVVFSVEDNGVGFTPDSRKKAFDAFFSTKEAGTGLGLYLVRKYIKAHGGDVFIEPPQELDGARVGFWIPMGHQDPLDGSQDKQSKPVGACP